MTERRKDMLDFAEAFGELKGLSKGIAKSIQEEKKESRIWRKRAEDGLLRNEEVLNDVQKQTNNIDYRVASLEKTRVEEKEKKEKLKSFFLKAGWTFITAAFASLVGYLGYKH